MSEPVVKLGATIPVTQELLDDAIGVRDGMRTWPMRSYGMSERVSEYYARMFPGGMFGGFRLWILGRTDIKPVVIRSRPSSKIPTEKDEWVLQGLSEGWLSRGDGKLRLTL